MMMARTSDHELIERFVMKHLTKLELELEQCNAELIAQHLACPLTLPSLDMIDISLKAFVRSHQKHWQNQVNYQLTKFQNKVRQQELWKELLSHRLSDDQVRNESLIFVPH
jgi:hypothetical protein